MHASIQWFEVLGCAIVLVLTLSRGSNKQCRAQDLDQMFKVAPSMRNVATWALSFSSIELPCKAELDPTLFTYHQRQTSSGCDIIVSQLDDKTRHTYMQSIVSSSLNRLFIRSAPTLPRSGYLRNMATAMSKRLEGKTILITGASSGIGKSTAQEFARTSPKNLKIIVTARRLDSLKQLAEEIKKEVGEGVKVHPVQLDVSNASEIRGFVDKLPDEFKQIDVLVNNAGLVKGVDQVGNIKEEDLNVMFATNVTGLINMTQAVLPSMKSRGESGQGDIINIGSIAGRDPYTEGAIYCATKAAVRSFTESMRKELIATRIRVIEIDPGQVETEFSVVRFYGDKAKADAVYAGCEPLTPDDIAEIIVFAAGRRENVVVADTLIYPNHQASAKILHKKSS
ncbi:hypothetical protein AMS68_004828 [Peltaster fructicola]|uniref:Oxidoreductase n=1 Tax=Peltaster fructicola TaxID=286661 RepID=A0A6H0XXC8_9PEZI|nr:hypothetical protein AMS68_004828 [Peltaster fructicola]